MGSTGAMLQPYSNARAGRRFRPLSLAFVALYCAFTGAAVALLPPQLMFMLGIPILLAIPVILWLMPDGATAPEPLLATLLIALMTANVVWPIYLSIDLPGLPWINPGRIIAVALLVVGLYSFSASSRVRSEVSDVLGGAPLLRNAFWIFWFFTLITIPLSSEPVVTINKWANNQIYWTFLFVFAAWIGSKPGVLNRFVHVLVWATILIALETIYEYSIKQVPWMNHIPSWLKIDDAFLTNILSAQGRAGTDIYRAHGTFAVALTCAEYFAILFPFVIHSLLKAEGTFRRVLMFMGFLAVCTATWFTNSRSGVIGFFMAVFLYGGFAAIRYWRRNRSSLVAATVIAMLPIAAMIFLVLSLTWTRLHNMTFGGAQQQPSSDARKAQWAMGTPKIKANPIGHGTARAARTLNYANRAGQVTIDTYYLSLLLEYGVFGFAAFMAMFVGQAYYGIRAYFSAVPGEEDLAGPCSIALLIFVVIKSVLSSEYNMPLAFVLLGFLVAILWRQRLRLGTLRRAPVTADGMGELAMAR